MRYWIGNDKAKVDEFGTWDIHILNEQQVISKGGGIRIQIYGREAWPIFQNECPKDSFVRADADNSLKDKKGEFKQQETKVSCCYTTANCSMGTEFVAVCDNTFMQRAITFVAQDIIAPESEIVITLGDKSGGGKGCNAGHLSQRKKFELLIDFEGRSNFKKCSDPLYLNFEPDRILTYKVILPSCVRVGEIFEAQVCAFDKHGNPATDCNNLQFTRDKGVKFTQDKYQLIDGKARVAAEISSAGVVRITGLDEKKKELVSNPVKVSGIDEEYKLFWGDLHGHSFFAASLETPSYYFEYARDIEKLDFVSMPDNDGNMVERKIYSLPQGPYWTRRESAWSIVKYLHDYYHNPGRFVTILAWEWTSVQIKSPQNSIPCGHRVVYFPANDGDIFPHTEERSDNVEKLWQLLRGYGAFTIPHHPAYPLDRFITGVDWRYHDPSMEFLVEIYSKQGTSEYHGNPRPVNNARAEGHVQYALNKGYRLGFVGGSDTHITRPGSIIKEPGKPFPYKESGLTAVYAKELSREAILDALKHRRCYATTGHRIIVEFSINGHFMGEEFAVCTGDELDIQAFAAGTDEFEKVEIIKNGAVFYEDNTTVQDLTLRTKDIKSAATSDYYYLRVTQKDGCRAWSSPIWIDTV